MPPLSAWLKFVETEEFHAEWEALGLGDPDLARLQAAIVHDPECGPVVSGTGGLRKMRFAEEGEGKSGAYRVCYANFLDTGLVYLFLVFGKRDKANLSQADRNGIKQLLAAIGKKHRPR